MKTKKVIFECPSCGDKTSVGFKKPDLDPATLAMMTMYHMEANPGFRIGVSDVDTLLELARKFEKKYKETEGKNWERAKIDWETAIIDFYNENRPSSWDTIK